MTRLLRNPLFLVGLAVRIALIALVTPAAVQVWYEPFLANSLRAASLDPWSSHLALGGSPLAFPYGYAMWLEFLPLTSIVFALGLPISLGYGLTLLTADLAMLWALRQLTNVTDRQLLALYFLSPIVIFATYWLGFNDLLPIVMLILALAALKKSRPRVAGVVMGLAVSAKLSMVLAIPFVLIYLFHNKRLRIHLKDFAITFGVASAISCLPHFASSGGRRMLFGNPELSKIYDVAIPFGTDLHIYLLPLVYLLVLFGAWRVRRMSFELLLMLLGIGFFLVLLLTPASPGWFVWVLPFLVLYQARSDRVAMVLVGIFSLLYVGLNGLLAPLPDIPVDNWPAGSRAAEWLGLPLRTLSLWQTLLLATGLIIAARMLRQGVQANEFFRLSRRPFILGIAGDSGAGKDTLASAISGLFGQHSVVHVSGDDYHVWDRQRPMWQALTHLNPRANELGRFAHDVQALANGQSVSSRHYDHASGRMSRPSKLASNDFIIVSGLHALYLPPLLELYDLRIYLDMDEGLRQHLKLVRDVATRGHSREAVLAAMARREPDSVRFIRPQAARADLVLALQPVRSELLAESVGAPPLRLVVYARHGVLYEDISRVLIAICGLHVDLMQADAAGSVELTVEGDAQAEDIALAVRELLPQLAELLDISPAWTAGMQGVMQLIVLAHITQALRARLL